MNVEGGMNIPARIGGGGGCGGEGGEYFTQQIFKCWTSSQLDKIQKHCFLVLKILVLFPIMSCSCEKRYQGFPSLAMFMSG